MREATRKFYGIMIIYLLSSSFTITESNKLSEHLHKDVIMALEEMGIQIPEILLPVNLDVSTWATVACDQYTQDREYWKQVDKIVGNKPSTAKITFPEAFLGDSNKKQRIENIRKEMENYVHQYVFKQPEKEFIYLERTTRYGRIRHGLIAAIDLEAYDWRPFTTNLIRATEATIVKRIPPRIEIRKGAPIEVPHTMLLINDPEHFIIENIGARVRDKKELYSGELMQNSGSIKGWQINTIDEIEHLKISFEKVFKQNTDKNGKTFLFAVGDGNHSLATAKAIWEQYKKEHPTDMDSKLRYTLIEIVNIYDSGLTFEPIHRVIFNVDSKKMLDYFAAKFKGTVQEMAYEKDLEEAVKISKADFGFIYTIQGKTFYILLKTPITKLAVAELQPALDAYLEEFKKNGGKPDIDFIHGTEEAFRLGKQDKATTILLPPIAKDSFFDTINSSGPLPRKSFSMGEADEKRFYLECRSLV